MPTQTRRATADRRQADGPPASFDYPHLVAGCGGAFLLISGLWAMLSPRSFFDAAAEFEPYSQHLVQDIGAFQIGLGAVLLLVLFIRDSLAAGLLGVGIGSVAHVASHLVGRDLGGTPALDIPLFSIFTALLLSAGLVRWRHAAA